MVLSTISNSAMTFMNCVTSKCAPGYCLCDSVPTYNIKCGLAKHPFLPFPFILLNAFIRL